VHALGEAQLVQQFKDGWVERAAAEVAVEVAGRPATDDGAARLGRKGFSRHLPSALAGSIRASGA
jgi:hypothetical protein